MHSIKLQSFYSVEITMVIEVVFVIARSRAFNVIFASRDVKGETFLD